MHGWILYKYPEDFLSPGAYEMHHLLDTGRAGGVAVKVVTQEQFDLVVTRNRQRTIRLNGQPTRLPEFLLPRRGAGTTYFCLAIMRHLEYLGVHVINSAASVEVVRDKLYTQQLLARSGLPFARTMLARFPVDADLVERTLGFPLVVKTLSGSQGRGVFLVEHRQQFLDLLSLLNASNNSTDIILQEFIRDSFGRDLRVLVIGGEVVACMKRQAPAGSFKANVSGGGTAESYPVSPLVRRLACEAARLFGLDIAGVDLLFDGASFRICEVNSAPGFKGIESCHPGLNVSREIYRFVHTRLQRPSKFFLCDGGPYMPLNRPPAPPRHRKKRD